jgi:hypothetical protein
MGYPIAILVFIGSPKSICRFDASMGPYVGTYSLTIVGMDYTNHLFMDFHPKHPKGRFSRVGKYSSQSRSVI